MPLSCLSGSVIGVDAIYYLETLLAAHKEPLLSALGGFPLALENTVKKELDDIQSSGLKLHFVFNGLDFGIKDDPFRPSIKAAQANAQAFETYESDRAQEAIEIFRTSGMMFEKNVKACNRSLTSNRRSDPGAVGSVLEENPARTRRSLHSGSV